MQSSRLAVATVTGLLVLGSTACDDSTGAVASPSDAADADAVGVASLEETGTAQLEGDDIVVQLDSGPVRLTAAEDTAFFVCDGPDDCEEVDEATFRSNVDPGEGIRVLGPNAELISPDAERLPAQVWVVLEQTD